MLGEHDIDQELKAALSVTPSADFEARVLRRLDARAERRAWWWPSYAVIAAAAMLLLVAGVTLSRRTVPNPPAVAGVAAPQPAPLSGAVTTPTVDSTTASASATSDGGARVTVAHRAAPTHGRPAPPPAVEVIVPTENVAALQRLVEGVNNGTVEVPAAPAEAAAADSVEPEAPGVEALVVNPITVPAADVHQSGLSPVMRGF